MKKDYLTLLLLVIVNLYFHANSYSQDNSKKPDESSGQNQPIAKDTKDDQLSKIDKELAELKRLIQNGNTEESVVVGYLVIKQYKDIHIYNDSNGQTEQQQKMLNVTTATDIDSIIVITKNGYIVDIQVVCKNKMNFTNYKAPISLTLRRISCGDKLRFHDPENPKKNSKYILVSDFLLYVLRRPYLPDDEEFVLKLNSENPELSHTLKKGVGLNTIFDIRLYSDMLGVLGGAPNGLFQTDANFKQIIHRTNIPDCGVFLFQYLKFNFTVSKFDSKNGVTDSIDFNRSSLLQKSWLNTELLINIFNYWVPNKTLSYVYFDIGGGINLSNLGQSKDTITTTSYSLILEPGYEGKVADNIGFNISSRVFWNWSPQVDFLNYDVGRFFIKPSFGIYWNPLGSKANRIFGRVAFTVDTKDPGNSFLQVQFGYSLVLTKLIK